MRRALDGALVEALRILNARRLRGDYQRPVTQPCLGTALPTAIERASTRLALYGTLAPGRPNHDRMKGYAGTWRTGIVRGTLHEAGWGAAMGAPGLSWHLDGSDIAVHLLESEQLVDAWSDLDAFEGDEYVRILVPVETAGGVYVANLYALREEMDHQAR